MEFTKELQFMKEEVVEDIDQLEARIGKSDILTAVKEYIRLLPSGEYAASRLRFFCEAMDGEELVEKCLTEVAIQECLLKQVAGIVPFVPAKYLKSDQYRMIKSRIQKEYDDLLKANPHLGNQIKSLRTKSVPASAD
jgi:hypothetical protein